MKSSSHHVEVKKPWHQDPSKWVNKHEHYSSMSSAQARVEFLKSFPDDICQARCWRSGYTPDRPWQVTYLCRVGVEVPQQFGERVAAEIREANGRSEKLTLKELTREVQIRKKRKYHCVGKQSLPENWKDERSRGPEPGSTLKRKPQTPKVSLTPMPSSKLPPT